MGVQLRSAAAAALSSRSLALPFQGRLVPVVSKLGAVMKDYKPREKNKHAEAASADDDDKIRFPVHFL